MRGPESVHNLEDLGAIETGTEVSFKRATTDFSEETKKSPPSDPTKRHKWYSKIVFGAMLFLCLSGLQKGEAQQAAKNEADQADLGPNQPNKMTQSIKQEKPTFEDWVFGSQPAEADILGDLVERVRSDAKNYADELLRIQQDYSTSLIDFRQHQVDEIERVSRDYCVSEKDIFLPSVKNKVVEYFDDQIKFNEEINAAIRKYFKPADREKLNKEVEEIIERHLTKLIRIEQEIKAELEKNYTPNEKNSTKIKDIVKDISDTGRRVGKAKGRIDNERDKRLKDAIDRVLGRAWQEATRQVEILIDKSIH